MKALKALVIVMGVLIVAALTVVVVTVVQRAGAPEPGTAHRAGAPAPSVPIAGAPAPGFGETDIALPRGTSVVETRTGDGRIVLRVQDGAGGNQALVVIDARTGRRLGLIRLK